MYPRRPQSALHRPTQVLSQAQVQSAVRDMLRQEAATARAQMEFRVAHQTRVNQQDRQDRKQEMEQHLAQMQEAHQTQIQQLKNHHTTLTQHHHKMHQQALALIKDNHHKEIEQVKNTAQKLIKAKQEEINRIVESHAKQMKEYKQRVKQKQGTAKNKMKEKMGETVAQLELTHQDKITEIHTTHQLTIDHITTQMAHQAQQLTFIQHKYQSLLQSQDHSHLYSQGVQTTPMELHHNHTQTHPYQPDALSQMGVSLTTHEVQTCSSAVAHQSTQSGVVTKEQSSQTWGMDEQDKKREEQMVSLRKEVNELVGKVRGWQVGAEQQRQQVRSMLVGQKSMLVGRSVVDI